MAVPAGPGGIALGVVTHLPTDTDWCCELGVFDPAPAFGPLRGLFEDVLRIWDAKRAGMDLGSYLGVQLLRGAGPSETKQFLAGQPSPQAAEALAYIRECEGAGDFVGFSPGGHLEYYRRYFGATP